MTYTPAGQAAKKKLVFVGKGLTFDTGGICIKPAPGMEEMKGDMGGAANVVALMAAVAAVKPNVEVHGIIGCAENMPDGNAYRPGDIFGSLDGKTVEIINTDAEGRLVLADVLAYGRELKPDVMVDNATLTGACVVALGPTVLRLLREPRRRSPSASASAAEAAGEAMWQHAARRGPARAAEERLGRPQAHRRSLGRLDHRGALPARVRRRHAVDPRRHRRPVHGQQARTASTPRAAPATACSPTCASSKTSPARSELMRRSELARLAGSSRRRWPAPSPTSR